MGVLFRRSAAAVAASLAGSAGLAVAGVSVPAHAAVSCPTPFVAVAGGCSVTLGYTGQQESLTLPADASSVAVEVAGAPGGGGVGFAGGAGGKVSGTLAGAGGKKLLYLVGATGGETGVSPKSVGGGGFSNAQSGVRIGGGGSFLARGDTNALVAVAGGGGGGYSSSPDIFAGGAGSGGAIGGAGKTINNCVVPGGGGSSTAIECSTRINRGDTQPAASVSSSGVITPGDGGNGGGFGSFGSTGGGGYRGGAGSSGGSGSGGSGYSAGLSGTLSTESTLGGNTGGGYIKLSYTPVSAPDAPTGVTATARDTSVLVSWTAPASDGGAALTSYTVTGSPSGSCTAQAPFTACEITGLTNGTSHTFTVKATNSVGSSTASAASSPVTPLADFETTADPYIYATGAYPLRGVKGGTIAADLSIPTPAAPQDYQWQVSTDRTEWSDVAGASGTTVGQRGGLSGGGIVLPSVPPSAAPVALGTSGVYYRIRTTYRSPGYRSVTAYSNTVGPVLDTFTFKAALSSSATPLRAGVPVTATTSDATTEDAAYSYQWFAGPGSTNIAGATGATFTPTASEVGKTIGVRVTAKKADFADATASATSAGPVAAAIQAPGAPGEVQAVAGNGTATVSWSAPASDGGAAITGYTVTGSPGGSCVAETTTTCTVTGLTNGTSYTFSVTAMNSVGASMSSASSSAVTPLGVWTSTPAPIVQASDGTTAGVVFGQIGPASPAATTLAWQWQTSTNGTSDWTDVAGASGSAAPTSFGLTVTPLTSLTAGSSYRLAVTFSKAGYPDVTKYSTAAGPITAAATVPGAPTDVVAVAGDGEVTVSWTPPTTDGGSAITRYVVDQAGGGDGPELKAPFVPDATGRLSLTYQGLTNGRSYAFEVTAVNAKGRSVRSASSAAVTPTPAGVAPTVVAQPVDVSVMDERTATFAVQVAGTPLPDVVWQRSGNGGRSWSVIAGATGLSHSVTGSAGLNNSLYRAVVSNVAGSVTSDAAKLSVSRLLRAPGGLKAVSGDGALSLSWSAPSVANGPVAISGYVVQVLDAAVVGGVRTVCETPAGVTSCVVDGLVNGRSYSFSVAAVNAAGVGRAATTRGVPLRPVTFTSVSESSTVRHGQTFTLSAVVSADPVPSLRWQMSSDGGRTWRNAGAAVAGTSLSYTEKANVARSGWRYRVKASQPGGATTYSSAVVVTITR